MDNEMVYFIRILLLIFKGGKMVCKGILDKELKDAGVSLDQILKEQEEKLKNKILRIQHSLLFPRNDRVNPGDFDLSLLIVVLLDVMNMPEEIRKLIKTIKENRDEIIHGGKVALTQATYESMKASLTDSLPKLGESLSDDIQVELSQMIQEFLTEPFGGRAALRYVDGMKNEEEILQWVHSKVEELVGEITTQECQMIENMKQDQEIVLDKLIQTMEEFNEDKKTFNGPKKRETSTDINCMRCFESYLLNSAVFYCATCKIYLCDDCHTETHTKSLKISMKNHHIQNAEAAAETVDMKGMDICDTHNEIITYYCKNHKELCCDKCKNNKHDNCHQLDEIEKFAQHSFNEELNPVAEIEKLQRQIGQWNNG
ncbi:uncharacterized protein LOC132728504 [Ruditapes philippinarum]|uniref:uncharacterized protein LOC132728504 n=1 Tax=Ruditapes philippinarum TaxID=129788 RepID=UPI00295B633B|nr:uncharacterized protein LOC132728504 [Ruditapes philippinarum]XP_060570127.1 uncharacterized protein LOC132728504 [Ruditapes philippinarum]XP_060570128.1 uncharacterized protein LOC132728504 [Ruditapes philippinarum]